MKPQALFTAHRDGVYRYLSRAVGSGAAADLTQEVFLRVSRTTVPETSSDGERAWIYRNARNLALNHHRDTGRQADPVAFADASRPASQETALALRQALGRLQPLDRDVFLLRESAGLSYDEIARSCDITADAVRARLRRAREALRQMLQPLLSSDRTTRVRFHDDQ